MSKFLLAYDFLLAKGGAEKLSIELCQHMQQLDLLVGFINKRIYSNNLPDNVHIQSLGRMWRHSVTQALLVSHAFEHAPSRLLNEYEKVIFSGSYAPLAVKQRLGGGNILYCHTPPRFIYDLQQFYLNSLPVWQRPLFNSMIAYLKPKYEAAVDNMQLIIANSKNVRKRIQTFLNRDSTVIYPPCDTDKFNWLSQGDYFLSTARLEPYKRIDLIIKAFLRMPEKTLVVTSGGSQLEALKRLAQDASNIHFTGWCSDEKLLSLIGNAKATIYIPMNEDFGMSPVESMSAGKPVIGVDEGGVKETVIHNETGILCPASPAIEDVVGAINQLTNQQLSEMRIPCQLRAEEFNKRKFFSEMAKIITE